MEEGNNPGLAEKVIQNALHCKMYEIQVRQPCQRVPKVKYDFKEEVLGGSYG